jgi:uncharacterized protein (DUF736 family)
LGTGRSVSGAILCTPQRAATSNTTKLRTLSSELATLTVPARKVVFQPNDARGDKAPSHRIISPSKTGNVELGAA